MKNRYILGLVFLIAGLLTAIGPFTIFHVCNPHEGDMIMKCYWTARAELGLGILISLLAVISAFNKKETVRAAYSVSTALAGVLVYLIPNILIGVCDGVHMHCHAVAKPALSVIGILTAAIAAVNAFYLYRKERSAVDESSDNK